ncbi:hypothetical protein J5N97_001289 [Dioscorea zingiberensis]|uniref:Uncharacterized protein n=1 Tax=Dioscorea zingiberensis TaxID=325984 RepID=A0A9D5H2C6_9LILI|nr:hypothetical protein J5N97_001289 [Dioscorea zingiberensis]
MDSSNAVLQANCSSNQDKIVILFNEIINDEFECTKTKGVKTGNLLANRMNPAHLRTEILESHSGPRRQSEIPFPKITPSSFTV